MTTHCFTTCEWICVIRAPIPVLVSLIPGSQNRGIVKYIGLWHLSLPLSIFLFLSLCLSRSLSLSPSLSPSLARSLSRLLSLSLSPSLSPSSASNQLTCLLTLRRCFPFPGSLPWWNHQSHTQMHSIIDQLASKQNKTNTPTSYAYLITHPVYPSHEFCCQSMLW